MCSDKLRAACPARKGRQARSRHKHTGNTESPFATLLLSHWPAGSAEFQERISLPNMPVN